MGFVAPASCRQYRLTPRCEAPRSPVPIPHDRLEFSYSRSSGPGGQNVNKVCVSVLVRGWPRVGSSALDPELNTLPHDPAPHTQLNTRVELRFAVAEADWIPEGMRGRFGEQQRHRINKAGEFVVASQEHRTQLKNREDCLSKLEEALARAAIVPKKRNMRTGLTEWEKENRLKEKKKRSETKSNRRQKHGFDD